MEDCVDASLDPAAGHSPETPIHQQPSADNLLAELDQLSQTADRLQTDVEPVGALEQWAQLGMMAAAVAHEINGLLTPLTGYADLALASPDNPRLRDRALRSASESGRQAAAVLDAVLELSRAATRNERLSGNCFLTPASESCTATRLIDQWHQLAAGLSAHDRVSSRIDSSLTSEVSLVIPLSMTQIILGNLLRNALKAAPDSQITLYLTQEAGNPVIFVQDNGPGISEAVQDRLFDWGVSSNDKPDGKSGHGIGLALARALAVRAGGDLLLDDCGPKHDGQSDQRGPHTSSGACFKLILPAA